jgi:hypothetical protein
MVIITVLVQSLAKASRKRVRARVASADVGEEEGLAGGMPVAPSPGFRRGRLGQSTAANQAITPWSQGQHAALDYLARYAFRIAITNNRIVDDETVTYRYSERADGK